ncbi:MAG: single-stranded DNA-binding protein [Acidobacteria bacterium]|nr:single-stranded DNA-binding protein [Acidobacteriota bacterium]
MNKVILVGRLGKDPELKYTQGGTPVVKFSLATDETWKDQSGEKQQRTEWHNIVAWRKLAEICGQYLNKGKLVYIEGKLQTRSWDDKEGHKRYTTEVVADNMVMLSGKGDDARHERSAAAAASSQGSEANPDSQITDDDIPF